MIKRLQATLADGSAYFLRLPANVEVEEALVALVSEEDDVLGLNPNWLEAETGEWLRRSEIIALALRNEEQFSMAEIMTLPREDQEDFFSRHPLPDIHDRFE